MPQDTQGIDSKEFSKNLAANLASKHGPDVGGVTAAGPEARPVGSGDEGGGEAQAPPPARSIEEQAGAEAQADEQSQPTEQTPEEQQQVQETVEDAQQQLQETGTIDRDTYIELRSMGIDLPDPQSVPDELMPAYESIVDAAVQEHTRATQAQQQALELQSQVEDFARRLQEQPDDFLLAMAMNNPDVYNRVQEQLERAEHDEDYRELLERELNLKAREAAAERQQRAAQEQAIQQAAQQIRNRTRATAKRMGVESDIAEQVVAARITQNGGDITLDEVDQIVRSLAPQGALANARKQTQQAKTPQQQQKEQSAPTGERSGQGQPAGGGDSGGRSKTTTPARQGIRGIISRASERVDKAVRE